MLDALSRALREFQGYYEKSFNLFDRLPRCVANQNERRDAKDRGIDVVMVLDKSQQANATRAKYSLRLHSVLGKWHGQKIMATDTYELQDDDSGFIIFGYLFIFHQLQQNRFAFFRLSGNRIHVFWGVS
jgi:hypothetical protein